MTRLCVPLIITSTLFFVPGQSLAGETATMRAYKDSLEKSEPGEGAAQLGINIYNHFHPDEPLPHSDSDVLHETARQMGAGKSPTEAFRDASIKSSGINEISGPKVTSQKPTKRVGGVYLPSHVSHPFNGEGIK